ncbi:MAG: LuxR C-terminal-related transcriptional regulator, partial [Acidimicrobiales bacterium]
CLFEASPQVTLLDLDLGPIGRGQDVLRGALHSGSAVIIVSATNDEGEVGECIELGAAGWVPKSASYDVLLAAVQAVASGQPLLSPTEKDRYLRAWRESRERRSKALAPFAQLSRREGEVLGMLIKGISVDRIAAESYVSETTVRTQVQAVLRKLGVNSQLEAVAMASRAGWPAKR